MSVQVDTTHLIKLVVGATAVVSGVVAKNTATQVKPRILSPVLNLSGMILFTLGWVIVAYLIGEKQQDSGKILTYLSTGAIWFSASQMRSKMDKKEPVPMALPILFVLGWVTLGWIADLTTNKRLGVAAAGLVVLSMLVFLPWQRKRCIVDGPGMALFAAAWSIIILINSIVPEVAAAPLGNTLMNQLQNLVPWNSPVSNQ